MLRRNLWNVAYGALVTSATLTALGTFDRYRMRRPAARGGHRGGAEPATCRGRIAASRT
jgi:Rad3-related DNA helicase